MSLAGLVLGRPRLAAALALGLAAAPFMPVRSALLRGVLAWDVFCLAFLALFVQLMLSEHREHMAAHAARDREGEWTIFWLAIGAAAASFGAIIGLFSETKGLPPAVRGGRAALVFATLFLSWAVTHTLFAMRYAHEYYDRTPDGAGFRRGLAFPQEDAPDYQDFFYFSFVVGMTFQVSDVAITARPLRLLAVAQGILGFVFNTVILALSVNLGANLL